MKIFKWAFTRFNQWAEERQRQENERVPKELVARINHFEARDRDQAREW